MIVMVTGDIRIRVVRIGCEVARFGECYHYALYYTTENDVCT